MTPLVILLHCNASLQYLAAGTWKALDVAIRVTNEKVMSGDGHYFIEEAISVLKYVPYAHFWDAYM